MFSICFKRSKPGIPLHTKNLGSEHVFSPRQVLVPYTRECHMGAERGRPKKKLHFSPRVPITLFSLSFPRTGGCAGEGAGSCLSLSR